MVIIYCLKLYFSNHNKYAYFQVFDVIKTSAEDLGQVIPDSFSKNNLLVSWRFVRQEVLAKNNSTYLEVGMMVRLKIGFYNFIYSMLP